MIYRKQKALIATGFTRWSTQYQLAKAIEDSRQVLLNLAFEDKSSFQLQAVTVGNERNGEALVVPIDEILS
jgi:hypothetical protein